MSDDISHNDAEIQSKNTASSFVINENILGMEGIPQINTTSTRSNVTMPAQAEQTNDYHETPISIKHQDESEEYKNSISIPQSRNNIDRKGSDQLNTPITNVTDVANISGDNDQPSNDPLIKPNERNIQPYENNSGMVTISSNSESPDLGSTNDSNITSDVKDHELSLTANARSISSESINSRKLQPSNQVSPKDSSEKHTEALTNAIVANIDEKFNAMNTRCRVIEEELLKSNTTISESLNSISLLMQKFLKNQEILKMELETIKRSQLKIDVKNVRHISNKTRREGMVDYEGDVEYKIISKNLLRERAVSARPQSDSKKRKLSSNEQAQHSQSQPARPVKLTKIQRIADEVFHKSHPEISKSTDTIKQVIKPLNGPSTTMDSSHLIKNSENSGIIPRTTSNINSNTGNSARSNDNVVITQEDPSTFNFRRTNDLYSSTTSNILKLGVSDAFGKQLTSATSKPTNHIIEMNRPNRILGASNYVETTTTTPIVTTHISVPQSKIKQEETSLSLPEPDAIHDIPDNYDEGLGDTIVDPGYQEPERNNVVTDNHTDQTTVEENPAEAKEEIRRPKVKNFKLTILGGQKRAMQLYIVDNIIYTGDSPYSAISFVYFVDLKYSEIRRTREGSSSNFTFGFPHILIDEGDKAMQVLGMNLMTPDYLPTVEYFLGDFLQACHLVDDKLSPGCTTETWRRYRNLFVLLMNWRQLAREKRGFRRYSILHAVKEMENFRLHTSPRASAIAEPYALNKINQRKICESGLVKDWMFQVETTLPVIGQNGIDESNINAALDALLKPPPNNPDFIPYALVKAPKGVEIV
ncbi:similar to Saccharomyces cerevisiae YDR310C SUM1 Transcriptional repressor required for mitotic repression of middle sporulation-specific genes [Maudiozyma saulgeensis]|uniref:Similar to Saccharomyces cerevisiae YDR310C SUM1 Transcriptional repressor required for mitotic repression of middle sporulation-specific genes n=1 Tax=Maudiozyma saulgeensis TaxID=1789683 RepID=A0A1X7QYB1_9SACH|nr:similar to Saccharomyces cerevisiae YDR310C SUM1 Transcriptional repressor required for mitotic repression of middle sporulation-specific genes [Kazachstania saulgeensis]